MVPSSNESLDLEALEPSPSDKHTIPISSPAYRSGRVRTIVAVLIGAAIGSALTVVIFTLDRSGDNTLASPQTRPSPTVTANEVVRVGQPTSLDGWTIVARSYGRGSGFGQIKAGPDQVLLAVTMSIMNPRTYDTAFDSHLIAARYFSGGATREVRSQVNTDLPVASGATESLPLAFLLPASSRAYSIIIRKSLEAEKQSGTAVEINLNCC